MPPWEAGENESLEQKNINRKEIRMNVFSGLILALALVLPATSAAMNHGSHDGHGGHGQSAPAVRTYTTLGVVRSVAAGNASLVITHDPVPALNWPAMTMNFELEDPALADDLAGGDRVRFDFRVQGDRCVILDIETLR
jgi:Cu(I)/Ag(I) efflux system protein CusF